MPRRCARALTGRGLERGRGATLDLVLTRARYAEDAGDLARAVAPPDPDAASQHEHPGLLRRDRRQAPAQAGHQSAEVALGKPGAVGAVARGRRPSRTASTAGPVPGLRLPGGESLCGGSGSRRGRSAACACRRRQRPEPGSSRRRRRGSRSAGRRRSWGARRRTRVACERPETERREGGEGDQTHCGAGSRGHMARISSPVRCLLRPGAASVPDQLHPSRPGSLRNLLVPALPRPPERGDCSRFISLLSEQPSEVQ